MTRMRKKALKIMVLVPAFSQGSPVVGAYLFAKYLHEHNVDVVFVSLDRVYGTGTNIVADIEGCGMEHECLDIVGWWGLFRHRSRVQEFCDRKDVDVVVAYMLRPTLLTASLTNVVKIASVRGMLHEDYAIAYGKGLSKLLVSMELGALRRMDHVFSMTRPMTEWLVKEGLNPNAISLVNNCVDVRSVRSGVTGVKPRDRETVDIGMFSRFLPRKRVDVAVEAFAMLRREYGHEEVVLHLAGLGPTREKIEKMAARLGVDDRVRFHGFLSNPLSLMDAMDMVLLTSDSEGLPRCLMEALSLGKTCVASDIPGIRELVHDRTTGYLFPPGDAGALAAVMDDIIRNNRYIPCERLVDFMLKKYDVNAACDRMIARIEDIYWNRRAVGWS